MSFLPKDYSLPALSGQFMKLQDGENRIRVLSDAVIGWEGWKNNKPFRHEGAECNITPDMVDVDQKYVKPKINHFWAFVVYNCIEKKIQILQINQKTIMKKLHAFTEDEDFGDPKGYDIVISRVKNGDKTEYDAIAKPPKPVDSAIAQLYSNTEVNLNSLFEGEYPIKKTQEEVEATDAFGMDEVIG